MHNRRAKLRELEEAEGTIAVDVEHPQVVAVAGVVQHHLEMTAIAGRDNIERKLVSDKLADPMRLRARTKPASDKDGYDVRITIGPLPVSTRAAFMTFLLSLGSALSGSVPAFT